FFGGAADSALGLAGRPAAFAAVFFFSSAALAAGLAAALGALAGVAAFFAGTAFFTAALAAVLVVVFFGFWAGMVQPRNVKVGCNSKNQFEQYGRSGAVHGSEGPRQ